MPRDDIGEVIQWPDRHDPHVDRQAEAAIYEFIKGRKPTHHVWIGDNLDLSGISRWSVGNAAEQFRERVIDGIKSLAAHFNKVHKINPAAKLVWLWGNHDDRLDQWVEQYPAWKGIVDNVPGMLRQFGDCTCIDKIKIVKLLDAEDDFKIGKMHYAHGFSACKHVAAKHAEEFGGSITIGHAHTMQSFTTVKRGQAAMGFCIGHLSNRDARRYLKGRPHRWVTGFAVMEYNKRSGDYTQHLIPIVKGRFRYGGREYGA